MIMPLLEAACKTFGIARQQFRPVLIGRPSWIRFHVPGSEYLQPCSAPGHCVNSIPI